MMEWIARRQNKLRSATLAAALALAGGLLTGVGAQGAGSTLYVNIGSASCSDSGSGTQAQPFCHIQAAATQATAGQTVSVTAGTYNEDVSPAASGTSSAPITYTAAAGVKVTGGIEGFALSSRSWITIHGFTVTTTTGPGIYTNGGSNLTIDGNHVTKAGSPNPGQTAAGIQLVGTTNSLISNNLTDYNTDPGIYLSTGSTGNDVNHNVSAFNAEQWQRNAQGINDIASGNTIRFNLTHDNEDSGIQMYPGGDNTLVTANVSYNNGDHGIDDLDVTGGRVIGNTVYHNCTSGINVEGTSGSYLVENNISVDNAVYPAYKGIACSRRAGNIGIYDSAPASTIADYNLVWLTAGSPMYVWNDTSYDSTASLNSATGQEAHGLTAPPGFVSSAGYNLHLVEGSPAIDSANSGASGEQTRDLDGKPRIDDPTVPNSGAGPRTYDDRGAYEFQPATDTQAPTVPQNVRAVANSGTSVTVSWSASTDNVGVAGYDVYRGGSKVGQVGASFLSYTDTTVQPNTAYSYTVDAFDAAGNHSAQSAAASVTTPGGSDTQPPTVPQNVTANATSPTTVTVAWSASTDNVGVTGYDVYRGGTKVGQVNGSTLTYTDPTVQPSTTYSYTVDAFDAAGNHSAQSSAASVTTPAPANLRFDQAGSVATPNTATSTTIAFTSPVASGDLLVGWFAQYSAAGQVRVSDSVNGVWTRAPGNLDFGGSGDIALYYLAGSKAAPGGLTITVSAATGTFLQAAAADYSGAGALDRISMASGNSTQASSGSTAAVPAGELVFAGLQTGASPGSATAGNGFTLRTITGSAEAAAEDLFPSAAGAQTGIFNLPSPADWYAVVATFKGSGSADTQPPTAPTNVRATAASPTSATVTWSASTDNVGVTGYDVYRGGAKVAQVAGSTLTYTDTGLQPNTTYSYTVDAFDAAGNHSAQSAAATVTTPAGSDTQPPTVPQNVTATASSPTSVTVGWSASTDNVGVTGYDVYRGGAKVAQVAGSTLTYTDTGLQPNTTYSYTVDAFDAAGNHSAQSAAATVTTPAGGTHRFVQAGSVATPNTSTTATIGFGRPVAAGDLLVGWFAQYDAAGQVRVSDNINGAWTRAPGNLTFGGSGDIALYYLPNSKAAATLTITVSAGSGTFLQAAAAEYSGVRTLDQIHMQSGVSATASSGATGSVPAGEVVFAGLQTGASPGSVGAGPGYTLRTVTGGAEAAAEDQLAGPAGPQTGTFNLPSSCDWYAVVATFK